MKDKTIKEIEVKIFGIDVDAIRAKLLARSAEFVCQTEFATTHFDFPDGKLTTAGEYLRLRTYQDGHGTLTRKGKNIGSGVAIREEIETPVENAAALEAILVTTGFVPVLKHKKKRESYRIDNVHYDIDTYPNLPSFVEVEAPTQDDVIAGVRLLDYCMEQTFSGSIIDYLHAQSIDPATVGIQIIQPPQRTERTEQTPR